MKSTCIEKGDFTMKKYNYFEVPTQVKFQDDEGENVGDTGKNGMED